MSRHRGLPTTLVAASCLSLAVTSSAEAETADDEPAFDEEVVVTGSRIRRDPLDARESVLNIDARDRDRTGLTSLGDMLGRLPVSGSSLNTRFNSSGNFGFPADGGGVAAGASQVDLRHLGAKRVLVLVDGLRWVHGSSASGVSGATDLNTIPDGVVERIEVLRDGASAIYGSDAIAGVVNIVTRSASGLRGRVYGGSHVHGGETVDVEFAFGGTRGRTSASVSVDYTDQQHVSAADHEQTRWPKPGSGVTHGSTFTPQGRIIVVDPNTGIFVNCALNDGVSGLPGYDAGNPCGPDDDYHPWSNDDRFNYATYNLTLTPSRRVGALARIEHAAADNVRLFARVLVNNRESVNQGAPEPVWAGTLAETGSVLDAIVIDAANPYNPFGFDVGPGAFATRRPIESGPRVFRQNVTTRYVAGGIQGEWTVSGRTLYWDANTVWSQNEAEQTKHGAHNARKMLQALGPPDACARIPGCVPLNLFGGQGTITADMLDWIGFVQRDSSAQKLKSFTFNVTGDVLDLPAGPLAFAAGAEQRSQSGRFDPDPVVAAGDTAGLPAQPTFGGFDVAALYGEIDVPLLADAPLADLVDLSAAVRYFDTESFDSGVTGKAGLRWRPAGALLLRATWAQGYRAPSIGELFGGLTRLDAVIADPCASFLATNVGQTVVDNCIAAGVPSDGSYNQFGSQISVLTGGNESLLAETSTSSTFALTWQPVRRDPGLVGDLRFELVRYEHRVEDAITGYDAQAVLDGCYRAGVTTLCQLVQRSSRGGIARFRNTLFNVGSIRTAGWDFGVLVAPTAAWRLHWQATYLDEYRELLRDAQGLVIEERSLVGQTLGDQGKPAWKSSLTVDWQVARWRLSWGVRYIHALTERCSDFLDGTPASLTNLGLCSMPNRRDNSASRNRLGTTVYHDVQLGYERVSPRGMLNLSLGLNNAFNRDPPPSQSAPLNGYDPSVYDMPGGRLGYLRVAYSTPH
ncbi:MAG: TonB-dependent receptor [Gammaproteobacteria bacterium]|nr:TonB-dependent receptor [Gammaproteobacteria bacterium]